MTRQIDARIPNSSTAQKLCQTIFTLSAIASAASSLLVDDEETA